MVPGSCLSNLLEVSHRCDRNTPRAGMRDKNTLTRTVPDHLAVLSLHNQLCITGTNSCSFGAKSSIEKIITLKLGPIQVSEWMGG